jgi:hypothetical protein
MKKRHKPVRRHHAHAARKQRFTVAAGQQIYYEGKPFVAISREGGTAPVDADAVTWLIADCLNRALGTPGALERMHASWMAHSGDSADWRFKKSKGG